ncbi:threonine/homoserine/homoserine lactone efflux protein [Methanococcus maripaludis]|uniref:Threonine/homoserine/homoserine lactone efflux protein n=1 Tax=Methanococcus maripaludis TaxID=39152 RepID=A0A7J9PTZ0_METMI|nr:LysE family translocator [Methanococcus maripaludis]MBA2841147.1 threonine/homoserine/homoserine lactone efflux protein [Methanococcus maripaludis]MBA2860657.1 threonine/homoserine/homoserine lactone efflux protein [Methanococcus maripaludis]MBA2869584.1 threonine/homoserine/homoserine lactone efflux protein [Methanococcus maripaludis]
MIFETFLTGAILGFSMAAPIGPIGILCIQKTLNFGKLHGFASGFGAATADAIYGVIAAFGLTIISNYFIENAFFLKVVGGVFLIYLGINLLKSSKNLDINREIKKENLMLTYLNTFFLTLTNPMTIIYFTLLFSGFVVPKSSYYMSLILVIGVFSGSILWSGFLTLVSSKFSKKCSSYMEKINKISGMLLIAFALFIFSSALKQF